AHHHGTGRALDAVEQGNDGQGSIGVCPHCQVMPVRIWDTFVSDANTFALGIVYATDNGAKVIEGANGSLYHSAFAEAASQYAYDHGAVQTASGAAALVVSAGLDHGITLRPDETRELLEQTAERVLNGNTSGTGTPDPGAEPTLPADEQWTPHFGWGRADVGAAVGAIASGNI